MTEEEYSDENTDSEDNNINMNKIFAQYNHSKLLLVYQRFQVYQRLPIYHPPL